MKTLIVFAHPWHGSFNKAILDTVTKKCEASKIEFEVIDLNKDKFNPVMHEAELALFSQGKSLDPLVEKYQQMLSRANRIIYIFPIWWGAAPAILKGFIDKVMLKNFAYTQDKMILKGKLTHIKEAIIITTSEAPNQVLKIFMGNPIKRVFINLAIKGVGIKKCKWLNSDMTAGGAKKRRTKFLAKVEKTV